MSRHTDRENKPEAIQPDYSTVPREIRKLRQWVMWRYDWSIKSNAWAKVPYHPDEYRVSTTKAENWSTFETCLATFEQNKGKYDGIGFVFSKDDEYVGIDLDECVERKEDVFELTPFAANAVETLATYTEFSPSQTGLHFIGKAKIITSLKTKFAGNDIEMYDRERYFTFTGLSWQENPLEIREIQAEADKILAVCKPQKANEPQPLILIDLETQLQRALRNSRIKRLFDGDISEYGNDESRGDMALCALLAYYADGRADVLDAMFRQSKLMRPKWDSRRGETTYGKYTIDKVLASPREYFSVKNASVKSSSSYDTRKSRRFTVDDLWDKAMSYRSSGEAMGVTTGWRSLDSLYKPNKRSLSLVTGRPSSGKSTFVDALCYNIAKKHGWKFTFASFETLPIERHLLNLCQIHLAKPTFKFVSNAATDEEMEEARKEIRQWFHFILPDDDEMDMYSILKYVDDDIRDYGVSGFVLDPFTEVEQIPSRNQTQTHLIKQMIMDLQRFTQRREIASWLIAHPTKPNKDTYKDGRPTLYSIADSANFFNKIDFGLVVHRNESDKTTVYVDKVRNDINGKCGEVEFDFDKHSKSYSVLGELNVYQDWPEEEEIDI